MLYTVIMTEIITSNEKAEKILNEREVVNVLEEIMGRSDYEVVQNIEDDRGLWKFSVRFTGEDGELVQYDYRRDDNNGKTVIDVVYFSGDMPVGGGKEVQKYQEGEWVA